MVDRAGILTDEERRRRALELARRSGQPTLGREPIPFPQTDLPPALRSDSDLMLALTRLLERLQKPIGQRETAKPLDTIGGMAGAARRRLDEPIGGAQTYSTSGGASAAGDIDEMRRQARRPPPSLDQPTPGGAAPSPLSTGLDAAAPGLTRGLSGLGNAIAGLGGAVGGAFNYSPSLVGAAPAGGGAQPIAGSTGGGGGEGALRPGGASPIPGAPGPSLNMAPSAAGGAPGGEFSTSMDLLRNQGQQAAAVGGGASAAGRMAPLGGGAGAATDPFAAGGAFGRFTEGQNELMYRDPKNAVRGAFRSLGIDPERNIYAQMTIDRYGPSLQSLAEVFQWVATGSPSTGGAQDNLMPAFLKHFMSGGDVRGLLSKAFDMAMQPGGEAMREGLGQLGAEQLEGIAQATSGVGRGTRAARSQLFEDMANRRAVAQMQNPNEADEFAWMEDLRKAYGF